MLKGFRILNGSKLSANSLYDYLGVVIKGYEYIITYGLATNIIFDLSNNSIIAEIPRSIGSLRNLRLLNLSRNDLTSQIPKYLSKIHTLEELDLSNNNLNGDIPEELTASTMLASLDLSCNRLCGKIPKETQFGTFNVI